MSKNNVAIAGRLTQRQRDFAKLVAGGMKEEDAMAQVGYSKNYIPNTLYKLRNNKRIQELIEKYKEGPVTDNVIANNIDRQMFWTSVMNDPSNTTGMRLKASELLGRSEGDFVDRRQVETTEKKNPIVKMPNTSPEDWEKQWEKANEKTG
jgi:phage terminase small subunit